MLYSHVQYRQRQDQSLQTKHIHAITFTVTDNQREEDTIPIRIDRIVLSSDWKYIANLLELPDIEVRDNPLVDGRIVTYTSKVRLVIDISAATQKESNFILLKLRFIQNLQI